MPKIRADLKNYKRAFTKHAYTYDRWNDGSTISQRMILCYCVECGLKCLIMQDNCITKISQANEDIVAILGSHNLKNLLKEVGQAGNFKLVSFHTEFGEEVDPSQFHQFCRYCIEAKQSDLDKINNLEEELNSVKEWLKEVI